MIYAEMTQAQRLDWYEYLSEPFYHDEAAALADDWRTWPESQIDYETERTPDGYPVDEIMYELNALFALCVRERAYHTAKKLLPVIQERADILHRAAMANMEEVA